jgi:diguanylate cyclase (GGDEF)-like protein
MNNECLVDYSRDLTPTLLQRAVLRSRRFAFHDELTGLPNRRLLLDRYHQAVALATRQHRLVALLFLDLDGFKNVNDTHGHAAGDRILQLVAARLLASIRASDTACRYGGDEFVVLLPELDTPGSAVAAARKIRSAVGALCRRREGNHGDGEHRHRPLSRRRTRVRRADARDGRLDVSGQGRLRPAAPRRGSGTARSDRGVSGNPRSDAPAMTGDGIRR